MEVLVELSAERRASTSLGEVKIEEADAEEESRRGGTPIRGGITVAEGRRGRKRREGESVSSKLPRFGRKRRPLPSGFSILLVRRF